MVIRAWRRGIAALVAVAAAACGGGGEEARYDVAGDTTAVVRATTEPAADAEPAPDADVQPTPAADPGVRADLEARGGTDVVGVAILAPGPGGTAVTVEIHSANSGWPYVAELVGGSCESPTGVLAELGEMTAGVGGDARYERVLDRELLPPDGANRAVRIRGAGDPTAVVACGELGSPVATSARDR